MSPTRHLIAAIIGLVLIATTLGVATARGAMAADGQLCSVSSDAAMVLAHDGLPLLNADGTPVTLTGLDSCLDCVFAIAAPSGPADATARPITAAQTLDVAPLPHWQPARIGTDGQARAPPQAG